MFITKKIVGGREVTFKAVLQYDCKSFPKIIDVTVEGGGSGPSLDWIDAFSWARRMVQLADETQERMKQGAARREAERLARVERHEAKQKRGAAAQSLRAKMKNLEGLDA